VTWLDIVVLVVIILITWLESVRGFGRALFDFVGAIISLRVAAFLAGLLADMAPISQSPGPSEAFWFTVVFVILAGLTLVATRVIYQSTLLSLDVLDPLVGGLFGLASGMVVAHVFLKMVLLGYTDTEFADVVVNSFMGQELLKFRSYHVVVTALQNLGNW